jgi:hypothetical protein
VTYSKFSSLRLAALLAATLALSACGQHVGITEPNTPMTEEEAAENIAARLEKGAKVRKDVNELRDALKKVETVMKALGIVLNKTLGAKAGETLLRSVDRLPWMFNSLSRHFVRTELDGTWVVEAPLVTGLSLADVTQCQAPRARMTGKKVMDQEDVVLYVSDCNGANWDRLAKWIVHSDGAIEMAFWPLVKANLSPVESSMDEPSGLFAPPGACTLALSSKRKEISFACSQWVRVREANLQLTENLSIRDVPRGTAASASISVAGKGRIQAEFSPERAPQVTVCDMGEKCSNL